MKLGDSVLLPCGQTLPNRIGKSAMSEILGSDLNEPTEQLENLYSRWSLGAPGLLITGNVMVDSRALGEPKNVVLQANSNLAPFKRWAEAGKRGGNALWMQLNHPGKQSPAFLSPEPVAPSAVPLAGALKKAFRAPRALLSYEIEEIIERFATASLLAQNAGFTGVQIHGAHGYLVSQFLSPHHNQRSDEWGGTPEKRRRFCIEILKAIRQKVGSDFSIGIKINSSDYKKGGLNEEESFQVIEALKKEGIDLVEISGGTYEQPAMMGTQKPNFKEAYFSDFSYRVKKEIGVPVMLTGGFRTQRAMNEALSKEYCDVVGLARPFTLDPELPKKLLSEQEDFISAVHPLSTGFRSIDQFSMLNITWYENQIARIGQGKEPEVFLSPWKSVLKTAWSLGSVAFKKRRA